MMLNLARFVCSVFILGSSDALTAARGSLKTIQNIRVAPLRLSKLKMSSLPMSKEAVCWAAAAVVAGAAGTPIVVSQTKGWYKTIKKPSWCPPDRLFGPVWTLLYASIGYSAQIMKSLNGYDSALRFFALHFALNLTWAPLFFGIHRIGAAFLVNVALVASLSRSIYVFSKTSHLAAVLLVPYLIWLSFATALNYEIFRLNKASTEPK